MPAPYTIAEKNSTPAVISITQDTLLTSLIVDIFISACLFVCVLLYSNEWRSQPLFLHALLHCCVAKGTLVGICSALAEHRVPMRNSQAGAALIHV
jgi:hypothetical protein